MHLCSPLDIRKASSFAIAAIAAFGLCNPVSSHAEDAGYHVTDKQHLDGDVKWDYLIVDAEHRHLFITHGDRVDVFDVDKKQIAGAITNTHGVHGVALAAELDRGFTSNGKDNSVTIFALSTLKVIGNTPTEKKPDGIVYDPASKRVFAANGESGSLTPVDAVAGKSLDAIPLGGKPEFVAVDGKGRLFVNIEDKNLLVVLDTQRLVITHRYDLSASCDEPAGLSIDPATERLFVGCHNQKMAIVDAETGKILDTLPIGRGNDATAYDVTAKLAFSSNGDGTLNVISALDATHYQIKQTVNTMLSARTLAIDPVSNKVYLVAAETEPAEAATQQKLVSRPRFKPDTLTLITVSP
jgi:DNA-binding beta-propeller fold protein YncE